MKKIIFILLLYYYSALADTVMITDSDFNSIEKITKTEAQFLYLMKTRRLNDGQVVTLFQMPQDSVQHKQFVRNILRMSIEQYNRELDRITNSGLSTRIKTVYTKQEMIQRVSSTINSIGYIDTDYLIIYSGDSNVKTLTISD